MKTKIFSLSIGIGIPSVCLAFVLIFKEKPQANKPKKFLPLSEQQILIIEKKVALPDTTFHE